MLVLGCESSCDETGLALYDARAGLLSHALFSQIDQHALYGGVVPELASRDHIKRLIPLCNEVLRRAERSIQQIDAVAYTAGPGLAGALMTGALFARSLAFCLGCPAVGVHHMEAHLLAPMLEEEPPAYPFVCLLVSGGHTQLVRVDGPGQYRLLGQSIDDAAGEAFDKTAKMLGLPYPGGPHLARLAESGDDQAFRLPRPMLDRPGLDFSFSGLKTAAITAYRQRLTEVSSSSGSSDSMNNSHAVASHAPWIADLAASFETAVIETLLAKCRRALEQEGLDRLVISGGVSANTRLRAGADALTQAIGGEAHYPRLEFCTDNGAMIALAGAMRLEAGESTGLEVQIRPRWPLTELAPMSSGQSATPSPP